MNQDVRSSRAQGAGWGIALILGGIIWLLALAGVDLRWEVLLPMALLAIGVIVLVVPRRGVTDGLVGVGIVVAVIALAMPFVPGGASITAGEREHRVLRAVDLDDTYALGAGSLTLDLRDLELEGATTPIRARLGLGELIVLVSDDITVSGHARVGIGEVTVFGTSQGGIGPSQAIVDAERSDGHIIELDASVGIGRIEVTR